VDGKRIVEPVGEQVYLIGEQVDGKRIVVEPISLMPSVGKRSVRESETANHT
jgi:hypothetical protein